MANSFTDLDDLANSIRLKLDGSGIVGIDGWMGAGKTTLANALAKRLDGSVFDLDSALVHDQKVYVSALRMSEVSEALATHPRPLIVSGICLLEVFENVGTQLDARVYIKRMATWGWADEDELNGIDFGIPEACGDAVRQELRHYHQKWQPHLHADYEFQRTD